jgi:hypothetical protein
MSASLLEERPGHRAGLVRKAIIHTPAAAGALALTAIALLGLLQGNLGALIGLVIVGSLALALSFEAVAALRDLRSAPVTTRDRVARVWSKSRVLFFGRVHYLLVKRRVFEIGPVAGAELRAGDEVEIVHWPHTNALVSLRLVGPRDEAERPREPRPQRPPVPPPPAR